jgi:hypothetical protein
MKHVINSFLARIALPSMLALGSSCMPLSPTPATVTPTVSPEGIRVAVVAQACTRGQDDDYREDALAEESVRIEVQNATAANATIRREQFRLLTPDGFALKPQTWGAADPLAVTAGATQRFELQFMAHGLECTREVRLAPGTGVRLGDKTVTLAAVRFVPAQRL